MSRIGELVYRNRHFDHSTTVDTHVINILFYIYKNSIVRYIFLKQMIFKWTILIVYPFIEHIPNCIRYISAVAKGVYWGHTCILPFTIIILNCFFITFNWLVYKTITVLAHVMGNLIGKSHHSKGQANILYYVLIKKKKKENGDVR